MESNATAMLQFKELAVTNICTFVGEIYQIVKISTFDQYEVLDFKIF